MDRHIPHASSCAARRKEFKLMWRMALLGSVVLLPGCSYVGNPFDGFAGFIGDTHNIHLNPNRPIGDAENLYRAMGQQVNVQPLLPEPGNIWPGPSRPDPTLQDIEREQNNPNAQPLATPDRQAPPGTSVPTQPQAVDPNAAASEGPAPPRPITRGSSTPPGAAPVPPPTALVAPPARPVPAPSGAAAPAAGGGVVQTPTGPAVIGRSADGVQQYTTPNGTIGQAVPNGNGTTSLIGPDGTIQSVPTPR